MRFRDLKLIFTHRAGRLWLGLLFVVVMVGGCGAKTDRTTDLVLVSPTATLADWVQGVETPVPTDPAPPVFPEEPTPTPASSGARSQATATPMPTPMPTPVPVDPNPFLHTTNILLLGSDRRPNEVNWRTDVIMILALDFEKGVAGVISLPRDLYLDEIAGHKPNKINVVDYLGQQDDPDGGGPALLAAILEARMGVPIQHYLRFEFEGFKQVIDALGGVEIQVDCPVYEYLPEEDVVLNLGAGTHTLTGRQALSYVRTRRQGGDLERARRQQRMALAIREQLVSQNLLPKVPALYVALQDAVETDIGLVDAIRFTRFALQLTEESLHGMILAPPETMLQSWRDGMYVFVPDWDAITLAAQTVFDRPPLLETNTVGPAGDVQICR
ncbi:MAG: LCP family protein [Caldilineaceae bacterium]|nr:LCP family protein [Caldilineaceae bacterium]MBP8124837.1 LCP family protein [Caldilineaceae bacterium]